MENVAKHYKLDDTRIYKLFAMNFSRREISQAMHAGREAYREFKKNVQLEGRKALKYMEEHELHGIVLTGRPYHLDPEVNHGIDNVINQQGMVVLTEDSVSGMAEFPRPIRILDQWVYTPAYTRRRSLPDSGTIWMWCS